MLHAQRRSKTTSSGQTNPIKLLPCGKTSANHTSYKSINREMSEGLLHWRRLSLFDYAMLNRWCKFVCIFAHTAAETQCVSLTVTELEGGSCKRWSDAALHWWLNADQYVLTDNQLSERSHVSRLLWKLKIKSFVTHSLTECQDYFNIELLLFFSPLQYC